MNQKMRKCFYSCIHLSIKIIVGLITIFVLSPIWVEYPGSGTIYTKEDNIWVSHKGMVYHKPFCFDGYTVYPSDLEIQQTTLNNVFILKYRISEQNLYKVFDSVKQYMNIDGFIFGVERLIKTRFKTLEYFTYRQDLLDEHRRLAVFRAYLEPCGITVVSVDIIK